MKQSKTTDMAAQLVKATTESTATALNITYIQRDIMEIKQNLKDITARDENFVRKEDFAFWRNLLVSGLLLSIATGVIINLLKQ